MPSSTSGRGGRFAGSILGPHEGGADVPVHTVCWRRDREADLPQGLRADPAAPASSLAWLFAAAGLRIEWRHLAVPAAVASNPQGDLVSPGSPAASTPPHPWTGPASPPLPRASRSPHPPGPDSVWLPSPRAAAAPPEPPERPAWVPPFSIVIARRSRPDGGHVVTGVESPGGGAQSPEDADVHPPEDGAGEQPQGSEGEHLLGAIRDREFVGTTPFEDLGRLEVAPLPGLDSLARAVVRETGEVTVVSLPEDPLLPEVEIGEHLGFLDPVPQRPRAVPFAERPVGLVGLLTAVDQGARRHRAALGEAPPGEGVFELGAASASPLGATVPIWIEDGVLVTGPPAPPARPPLLNSARWALAPLTWGDLGPAGARAKVSARRALTAQRRLREPAAPPAPQGEPHAWLFDRPGPGMLALFAATHPVTGDQLLTRNLDLVAQLGYGPARHLGFLRDLAPVTGDLAEHPVAIPWLHRFNHLPR